MLQEAVLVVVMTGSGQVYSSYEPFHKMKECVEAKQEIDADALDGVITFCVKTEEDKDD